MATTAVGKTHTATDTQRDVLSTHEEIFWLLANRDAGTSLADLPRKDIDLDRLKVLIESGAKLEGFFYDFRTESGVQKICALDLIVLSDDAGLNEFLLSKCGVTDHDFQCITGIEPQLNNDPIIEYVKNKQNGLVAWRLLRLGNQVPDDALSAAAASGNVDALKKFAKAGIALDKIVVDHGIKTYVHTPATSSLLGIASRAGEVEAVRYFISQGIKLDFEPDRLGHFFSSPLYLKLGMRLGPHLERRKRMFDTAKILMSTVETLTPALYNDLCLSLSEVCKLKDVEFFKLLLHPSIDLEEVVSERPTMLRRIDLLFRDAANNNCMEIFSYLLGTGISPSTEVIHSFLSRICSDASPQEFDEMVEFCGCRKEITTEFLFRILYNERCLPSEKDHLRNLHVNYGLSFDCVDSFGVTPWQRVIKKLTKKYWISAYEAAQSANCQQKLQRLKSSLNGYIELGLVPQRSKDGLIVPANIPQELHPCVVEAIRDVEEKQRQLIGRKIKPAVNKDKK